MAHTYNGTLSRRGPDTVTEELVTVLSGKKPLEFKPLFEIVLANLRARNCGNGGEEMLRLRTYEKLQNLVGQGFVKKKVNGAGKTYQGITASLSVLTVQMQTVRDDWAKRTAEKAAAAG